MEGKTYLNAKELAAYLKLNVQTIYRKAKMKGEDRLPNVRMGRLIRFDKDAVDAWIYDNAKKP